MVAGDLTVTIVANSVNLVAAVAIMDAGNDATVDDKHLLVPTGGATYAVLKYVRAAA